jgi:TM2 domain-containing membrane protein YozV
MNDDEIKSASSGKEVKEPHGVILFIALFFPGFGQLCLGNGKVGVLIGFVTIVLFIAEPIIGLIVHLVAFAHAVGLFFEDTGSVKHFSENIVSPKKALMEKCDDIESEDYEKVVYSTMADDNLVGAADSGIERKQLIRVPISAESFLKRVVLTTHLLHKNIITSDEYEIQRLVVITDLALYGVQSEADKYLQPLEEMIETGYASNEDILKVKAILLP